MSRAQAVIEMELVSEYQTDYSFRLAEAALCADGITSARGEYLYMEAQRNLATLIGELCFHIADLKMFEVTNGKRIFRVYSGNLLLASKETACGALEQAHSDFTPCAALG